MPLTEGAGMERPIRVLTANRPTFMRELTIEKFADHPGGCGVMKASGKAILGVIRRTVTRTRKVS